MFEGLRKTMNEKPAISVAGLLVVVAVAGYFLWSASGVSKNKVQVYYTNDDGKTFFLGSSRVTPFMQGGKEVDQALVYYCSDNNKLFVGYLRRYPEKNRTAMEHFLESAARGMPPADEVKRPGDTEWVQATGVGGDPKTTAATQKEYREITQPKCPDGKYAVMHTVAQ